METRRILLREVRTYDLATLFAWRNTEKFRIFVHHTRDAIDYDSFCKEFAADTAARTFQYAIEKKDDHRLIGLTYVHSYSASDRHCFIDVFLEEPSEGRGYGVDVVALLYRFLVESRGMRRIYADALDCNTSSIAGMRGAGMTEVERFIGKKLYRGQHHDVVRFVAESDLLPKAIRLLQRLS